MDNESLTLIRKVWRHAGVAGNVWMPHIVSIGVKGRERFREGPRIDSKAPKFPDLNDEVDWYWTPAISYGENRRIRDVEDRSVQYPNQRVVWVDCDDSYDDKLLESLKPSYMWETSPGHKQAVWLLKDPINPSEFHRDGFIGMLTEAIGGDKSGVDLSQLLRVPGTWHHKGKPFQGKVLRKTGAVYTRGNLLSRVARGLGFSPALASELGAADPYGDRSKLLWKFSRNAAELGINQSLTFKLIKATQWNKWKDDPDRLKQDIERAYEQGSATPEKDTEQQQAKQAAEEHLEESEEVTPWSMATVGDFGKVLHKPMSWVLPGIIPTAGCGLLVAAPKVGKTRIAIELALGLASGKNPLGINIKRPTEVGFFSLEDGEYLFSKRLNDGLNREDARRQFHWDGHISTKLVWHPPVPLRLFTNFSQINLKEASDKAKLLETIQAYELKLVVIDTLSMAIGNSDVSNSKDMYEILKDIKDIAKATGCAVMFIHHTRKRVFEKGETVQEMILGSTALHGWSDFIMNLIGAVEEGDPLRLAVQTKMGRGLHYVNSDTLKLIPKPETDSEEEVADF